MRRIVFYCRMDESDVYEFPDDVTDKELEDVAYEWLNENVSAYWEEVEDD